MSDAAAVGHALRDITLREGRLIWGDAPRLRNRLQFRLGPLDDETAALVDAVALAARCGVPDALVHHGDLPTAVQRLSDAVGPSDGSHAAALWARMIADLEEPECARGPTMVAVLDQPTKTALARVVARPPRGAPIGRPPVEPSPTPPVVGPAPDSDEPATLRRRRIVLALVVVLVFAVLAAAVAVSRRNADSGAAPATSAPAVRGGVGDGSPTGSRVTTTAPPVTTAITSTTAPPPSTTAPPVATGAAAPAGSFLWLDRLRLADYADATTSVVVAVSGPGVAASVGAVVVQISLDSPTEPGTLSVGPVGGVNDGVPNLHYQAGAPSTGLAVTAVGADGRIEVHASSPVRLRVEALASFVPQATAGGSWLVAEAAPAVVADASVAPGTVADLALPPGLSGGLLSIRVAATEAGAVPITLFGPSPEPEAPTVAAVAGAEVATLALVRADTQGRVHLANRGAQPVRVAVSLVARIVEGPQPEHALSFTPVAPVRAVTATCSNAPGAGIIGIAKAFPQARVLILAVTIGRAATDGQLTVSAAADVASGSQSLTFRAGEPAAGLFFVPVVDDRVNLMCPSGRTAFVADVVAVLG